VTHTTVLGQEYKLDSKQKGALQMKVGDEVWHTRFTLSGQVDGPGVVTKIDSPRSIVVLWPDGIVENYDEHELSKTDPKTFRPDHTHWA
jgi:hypothetical protein